MLQREGFTLIDVIVGTTLMLIVFSGIFGAYQLGLKVVGQSKARIIAASIANEQLEEIRNWSYEEVGIVGGYPSGNIPSPTTTLIRNNVEFTVEYGIEYGIDLKDGIDCDPANDFPDDRTYRLSLDDYDCCPNDYKKIKIKVSWPGMFGGEISFYDIVAPRNSEQECGEKGGLLKIAVNDQGGNKVGYPSIEVTRLSTGYTWTAQPEEGEHYFLLEPSISDYKIEISKSGYSRCQTYGIGDDYQGQTIISPENPHITILEGQLKEYTFFIDKLSKFLIYTLEAGAEHIYYVRQTTGSDDNDGLSPDTAFLTIQKAASSTGAGDIVFVGAGDYEEEISILNSGSSGKEISFVGDTAGTYTGDSGEVKIKGEDYGFYIENKKYIKIYGFKITDAAVSAIFISGSSSNNIELVNNTVSNNSGDGIHIEGASNLILSHNLIYSNARGIYLKNANSSDLIKNTVYQNSLEGISIEQSNFVTLDFNSSFSNEGKGISVFNNSNNCQLTNNITYLNLSDGIQIFNHAASMKVLNNKSYSNEGAGISFQGNISNANKIISNLIYDNQKTGISLSENCVNNIISNNTCFSNQENGILIETSSNNNEVKDNIICQNTLAGIKILESGNIENSFNLLWQNFPDYDGISAGEGDISADPLLVDPDNEDFHLSQAASGQGADSPGLDAGSDSASNLEMDDKTTRTDGVTDSEAVDLGYHYSLEEPPALPEAPDPFGAEIPDTTFIFRGEKIVGEGEGENPIYKYSENQQTDSGGFLEIPEMEWDNYIFSEFESSGIDLDLIVGWPSFVSDGKTKVFLGPDTEQEVRLGLKAENTLFVDIQDASAGNPVFGAEVKIYNTTTISKFSDTDGQAYFIPLEEDWYDLEVTAEGYEDYLEQNVFISGHVEKTIEITRLE